MKLILSEFCNFQAFLAFLTLVSEKSGNVASLQLKRVENHPKKPIDELSN